MQLHFSPPSASMVFLANMQDEAYKQDIPQVLSPELSLRTILQACQAMSSLTTGTTRLLVMHLWQTGQAKKQACSMGLIVRLHH